MTGRSRWPALIVVALTAAAVIALSDPDVEVSDGAIVVAAGAIAVVTAVVATGLEYRDQHPFPLGVLLVRLSPVPVILLVMLSLWILPDSGRQSDDSSPLEPDEADAPPVAGEQDDRGVEPADIIDVTYAVLLVAAVVIGVYLAQRLIRRWIRWRRSPEAVPGATGRVTESDDPERWRRQADRRAVRGGLARGRAALLDETDPRLAIIGAYLAFEDYVRREGLVRDPAETQREYAARVLAVGGVNEPRHVTELVELFNAARFSTDPLGEADAVAAREHIDALGGS